MASETDFRGVTPTGMEISRDREQVASKAIRIKQEYPSTSHSVPKPEGSTKPHKKFKSVDDKPKPKRLYTKRTNSESNDSDKPPPKKRGRKSRLELQKMNNLEYDEPMFESGSKGKNKSQLPPKSTKISNPKKAPIASIKHPSLSNLGPMGPSMFDRKILAGPHLTMKQVLEYILTDHSYCVPPDPLPAVGSNHQMIRYILGPKDGAKPKSSPSVGIESGNNTPLAYISVARPRSQLTLSSTPSPSSKLENLLKRGEISQLATGGSSMRVSHSKIIENKEESDLEIDVETVEYDPDKRIAYDVQKARDVMNECEKYVEFARGTDTGDEWERKILKTGWTKVQSGLFDKVVGALHAERLSRLAYAGVGDSEPVLRRASLDRTACRVRRIFGEYLWDTKLTQWLHFVLTESLNFQYLAIYLDVLQTLKAYCPQLVSRMMKLSVAVPLQNACGREEELANLLTPFLDSETSTNTEYDPLSIDAQASLETSKKGDLAQAQIKTESSDQIPVEATSEQEQGGSSIFLPERSVVPQMKDAIMSLHSAKNAEALKSLLERQWDPFSSILLQRLKKLSVNPVFLMLAPCAILQKMSLHRRLKQYYRMFARVGLIIKVQPPSSDALENTSVSNYLEKLMLLAKEKLRQTRHHYADRPLYLVGWGAGSILAARLSVTAGPVDGIIALGFPLLSLRDVHDEVLKIFRGIKHPILFVIGGQAANNSITDMELFRKRLTCESSLVVVGSGNENLYVSRDHREKLLVTQSFVDKTIMDEIAYFVNLHSKHNQMVLPNISMKQAPFPKFPVTAEAPPVSKSVGLLRGKKRKSIEEDVFQTVTDRNLGFERPLGAFPPSRIKDLDSSRSSIGYEPNASNSVATGRSSNKRKPSMSCRSESPLPPPAMSSSGLTASKLLQQQQQTPNSKRRLSKPGNQNQPPSIYGQQQGLIASRSMSSAAPVPSSDNQHLADKPVKKKSTKPKPARATKTEFSSAAMFSAISDVKVPVNSAVKSASSSDMRKYVLQHQEEIRNPSPQLFSLLSPGSSDSSMASSCTSQITKPSTSEVRTTLLSTQTIRNSLSVPTVPVSQIIFSQPSASGPLIVDNLSTTVQPILAPLSADSNVINNISGGTDFILDADQIDSNPTSIQLISVNNSDLTPSTVVSINPLSISSSEQSIVVSNIGSSLTEPAFIGPSLTEPAFIGPDDIEPSELLDGLETSDETVASVTLLQSACEDSGTGVDELMDVDTDEEMSGLKISSTFSVCPTSGGRVEVIPAAADPQTSITYESVPQQDPLDSVSASSCDVTSVDIKVEEEDSAISVTVPTTIAAVTGTHSEVTEIPNKVLSDDSNKTDGDDSTSTSTSSIQPKPLEEKKSTPKNQKNDNSVNTGTIKISLPDVKLGSEKVKVKQPTSKVSEKNDPVKSKAKEQKVSTPVKKKSTPKKSKPASSPSPAVKDKRIKDSKVEEESDTSTSDKKEASEKSVEKTEKPSDSDSTPSESSQGSKKPTRRSARLKSGF